MNKDIFYMEKALRQANKALLNNEVPVGALLVLNDEILASSYNKKEKFSCVLNHAELNCIVSASKKRKNWRLDGATMYITLEPCPMCASAIQQSRIFRVVYGATSKNHENSILVEKIFKSKGANNTVVVEKNILEKECSEYITNFFKKKRI